MRVRASHTLSSMSRSKGACLCELTKCKDMHYHSFDLNTLCAALCLLCDPSPIVFVFVAIWFWQRRGIENHISALDCSIESMSHQTSPKNIG